MEQESIPELRNSVLSYPLNKCELYNKRNGELKDSVKKLLNIFECPLNELFPENYKAIETNKHIRILWQQRLLKDR